MHLKIATVVNATLCVFHYTQRVHWHGSLGSFMQHYLNFDSTISQLCVNFRFNFLHFQNGIIVPLRVAVKINEILSGIL